MTSVFDVLVVGPRTRWLKRPLAWPHEVSGVDAFQRCITSCSIEMSCVTAGDTFDERRGNGSRRPFRKRRDHRQFNGRAEGSHPPACSRRTFEWNSSSETRRSKSVRAGGLEPPHVKVVAPKTTASTNSATLAWPLYSTRQRRRLPYVGVCEWQFGHSKRRVRDSVVVVDSVDVIDVQHESLSTPLYEATPLAFVDAAERDETLRQPRPRDIRSRVLDEHDVVGKQGCSAASGQ